MPISAKGYPCEGDLDVKPLKCEKYMGSHVIIMNGISCMVILDLNDLTWRKINVSTLRRDRGIILFKVKDEVILLNGKNVYYLNQFKWKFQSRMPIVAQESTFVSKSKSTVTLL